MMFGPSFTTPGECLLYFFGILSDYHLAFIALAGAVFCCFRFRAPVQLFRLWKIFFAFHGIGFGGHCVDVGDGCQEEERGGRFPVSKSPGWGREEPRHVHLLHLLN